MKKTVIVTGGGLSIDFVRESLLSYKPQLIIASDRGIMALYELDILPDYLVGDFDSGEEGVISYYRSLFAAEGRPIIRGFSSEKDETDTDLALSLAISLGSSEILILGATGTRLDHTMANVGLLAKALEAGVSCFLADPYNVISLHDESFVMKKRSFPHPFFSFLAFGGMVKGLSIKGAKYELSDAFLNPASNLCISNEFLDNDVSVTLKEGRLLLFRTADEAVNRPFQ